jgi:hypothetical protein
MEEVLTTWDLSAAGSSDPITLPQYIDAVKGSSRSRSCHVTLLSSYIGRWEPHVIAVIGGEGAVQPGRNCSTGLAGAAKSCLITNYALHWKRAAGFAFEYWLSNGLE